MLLNICLMGHYAILYC